MSEFLTEQQVRGRLRAMVNEIGRSGQTQIAAQAGVSRSFVSSVLMDKRRPGAKLAALVDAEPVPSGILYRDMNDSATIDQTGDRTDA